MVDSTEFASHSNIKWQGHVGTVEYGGGDRGTVAMFYNRSVPDPVKARETGRPYNVDKVFVRIHPPGERLNIIDREANDSDRRRWPMEWAQFTENKQQTADGTPIDLLYPDHPSVAATLRASGVYTIEQCSELSGPAIDNIGMGAQRYCNDAKKFMEAANKGIKASQMRHELEQRDSEIRTLKQQLELLKHEVQNSRANNLTDINLADLQRLLAGQQQHPTLPGSRGPVSQGFDTATAQINALSPSSELAQQQKSKRKRVRLND